MKYLVVGFVFVLSVLAAVPTDVAAQSGGSLSGLVRDASGAVLPGVEVLMTGATTGQTQGTLSSDVGKYNFAFVAPGEYSLAFDLAGFGRIVREQIRVNVGSAVVIDVVLEIGGQTETLNIIADSPQLQVTTSSLGAVVENAMVNAVPLASRNFTQVLALSPGVTASVADSGAFGRNSVNITANGARPWDNGIILNGLTADNAMTQGFDDAPDKTGVPVPSPDALEEFKVQTGLFDAEYGKQAGAVVNVVTKSGGSQFHGTMYEFFRHDKLNANEFFSNRNGQPRGLLRQNQFGGTIGGPLVGDKSFFFVSYQRTLQKNGVSSFARRNTFLPVLGNRTQAALGQLYAGRSGTFGGVGVASDGSNINPIALAILNAKLPNGEYAVPDPQTVQPNGDGFSALSVPTRFTEDQFVANADFNLSASQTLRLKTFAAFFPSELPFSIVSNVLGFGEEAKKNNVNLAALHTMTLSSNTVNELRIGYNQSDSQQFPYEPLKATDVGMRQPVAEYPALALIQVTGMFALGSDPNGNQRTLIRQFEIANTLRKTSGRHDLRFGGNFSPIRAVRRNAWATRGRVTFNSFPDFLLGMSGAQNGTAFSNIGSSTVANGREILHPHFLHYAAFVQDDFRATDRLTLNMGLRYQFNGHQSDALGTQSNWDRELFPTDSLPPQGTLAGILIPKNGRVDTPPGVVRLKHNILVNSDNHLGFSPRIGLAWRPLSSNQNIVIRSGYGLFWSAISGSFTESALINPPFSATVIGGGSNLPSSTFENPFPAVPKLSDFPIYTPFVAGGTQNLFVIDPDMKQSYSHQYSANVQAEVKGLLVEVGYVGSRTENLVASVSPNQALLASEQNPIRGLTTNTVQNRAQRVPYLAFAPNGFTERQSVFSAHYNSLQVSVRKRYTAGLSLSGAYTFSRSVDNVGASNFTYGTGGRHGGNGNFTGDYYNLEGNTGLSDFDRTHRFVSSWLWQVPGIAANGNAFARALLNRWSVSGIATLQSGFTFSVTDTRGGTIYGVSSYAHIKDGVSPASVALSGRTQDRLSQYFDTTAFTTPPAIGNGTGFGNAPRNFLRGPGQVNFDMAFMKNLPGLNEGHSVEFRTEFFNIFNTPQFGLPVNSVTTSGFGSITSTVASPRIMQLALRYRF